MKRLIVGLAVLSAVLGIAACGGGEASVLTPDASRRPTVRIPDYPSDGANDHRQQEWFDAIQAAGSIGLDVSGFGPNGVLDAAMRGGDDDVVVLNGAVSGSAEIRLFDDSPIAPRGVTPSSDGKPHYAFVVIPVNAASVDVTTGTEVSVTELWFELGLVSDPAALQQLVKGAPSPGTPVLATSVVADQRLILVAGHGAALAEKDGTAAVALRGLQEFGGKLTWPSPPARFDSLVQDAIAKLNR